MRYDYDQLMTLALFVAPDLTRYDISDFEHMVEMCGVQTVVDFLKAYEDNFGLDLSQQIEWAMGAKE
tara:strand:+ start:640 stop:840 length:201 start_codon:yes stop_codon:yes gene_type:complete